MKSLARALKTIPAVYAINAAIKSRALSRESREVGRAYRRRLGDTRPDVSRPAMGPLVAERRRTLGAVPAAKPIGALRVFVVGTYFEQENSGFLQALRALGPNTIFENDRGEYGLRGSGSGNRDEAIASGNARCLIEQVEAAHRAGGLDVLIGTMVAQSLPVDALQRVRALGIPVVNIAMDDRLPLHWRHRSGVLYGAIGLAPATDLVLQTTPEYLERYVLEGCPAIFWPFGSDPDLFAPAPARDVDVAFVGNNYGWRHELIAAIEREGIHVDAFGHGFANGHIAAAQVADVFGRARVILGYGYVSYSRQITTLKLRDIDGPMAGGLYLTTHNPDLARLYDIGREIDTYATLRECVEKVKFYLSHDAERQQIAAAGRARALREHTWRQRLEDAFAVAGVLDVAEGRS